MTKTTNKYPSAFYAAAGVGDLVYEQLRKWQDKAVAFGNEQTPQWKQKVAGISAKVDAQKVRESVVTGTQIAADKATKVYDTLVTRGEKAMGADEAPAPAAKPAVSAPAAKPAVSAPVAKRAPRKRAQ